ncbi:mucin-19 isoform X16 [Drosophila sulfurigaster albostrigata]|uniref:mucin-19 isoform X16 n=1 Tax=Drosophila sulfurigaster albostrigata TaxID=89887 RepID=UPI002D21872C|nr:mucin-19 isoform X16 [Drosophila sulfurigaster albostrigata]
MDLSLERDSSALGSLFQQIINDMKNTSPLWEDFVAKASKLHTCLRAAIQAIAAYLDAFQKIADAATNSRGASKEIGTALTRVCLRHKAVETRLKTFTSAIMDCLVQPLQDKIEDWKRTVATIDKDHAKEYKRCRSELKKRSSDTLRLQKKARKGQTDNSLQSLMDSHMQDVTLRRAELEEVEKKSLRAAMVEERLRYCSFVHMLQPVVHEECEVMSELGHLQEAMESIALVTKEPSVLPQASEELIHDAKASINLYPESPGGGSGSQGGGCSNSLGSRKSSVCSISSMNSSGSSNSPGHHHYQRSLSQFVTPAIRLKPGESSDSGFCSSPALTTQVSNATNQTHAVSTWPPHSQDAVDALPPTADRPHTISTTYEKGHQRPPLTVYTFQNPETIHESNSSGSLIPATVPTGNGSASGQNTPATQKSPAASLSRPPLPVRCSSLERPLSAQSNHRQNSGQNLLQRQCPSPIPAHITKGTPSGGSIASGLGLGFVYQVSSPTPPASANSTTDVLKITEPGQPTTAEASETTESDERSRASVLQKASMFEKQAAAAAAAPIPTTIAAAVAGGGGGVTTGAVGGVIGGVARRSEELRAVEQQEMDKSFEDSIQALNNLIGELDSFQREIDEGKGKQQQQQQHSSNINSNNISGNNSNSGSNNNNSSNSGASSNTSNDNNNCNTDLLLPSSNIDCCAISNQTNSSGCGTDISDTTSEELAGEEGSLAAARRHQQLGASDSELSRCYVSETSSLTGGILAGGYENPTFAHFAANRDDPYNGSGNGSDSRSLYASAADSISLAASDSVCMSQQPRHAYVDNCSDGGSAVVVIYDHTIPNTPDIEFVKQNSEIVLLRTKDPQQLQLHEMRELQQLPDNLAGSPESPDAASGGGVGGGGRLQPATATVAPAKQRLSSFRASSEQQLQLLGRASPQHRGTDKLRVSEEQRQQPQQPQPQQQQQQQQQLLSDSSSNVAGAVRRKLPPKPISLSIFNGPALDVASSNSSKPVIPRKFDFKADLDAKIRQQKQKVQQQLQQQQQQQQQQQLNSPQQDQQQQQSPQQHSPQSPQNANTATTTTATSTANCNVTNKPAVIASAIASASINQNHRMPNQTSLSSSATSNHAPYKTPTTTATFSSPTSNASASPSSLSASSPGAKLSLPSLSSSSSALSATALPPPHVPAKPTSTPTPTTTTTTPQLPPPTTNSYACSNLNANANANPQAKPCITPRPASLSGGAGGGGGGAAMGSSTRIARRSSINQAKPPPPVRRSSSVTPSPNNVGQPQHQQHSSSNHNSHAYQQQSLSLSNSSEHLPPPPAFMLEATTAYSTSPTPPAAMPSSALKVSETVRALAAMRHQPASPVALRRMHQQQQQQQQLQQQQQQSLLQPMHKPSPNDDAEYEAYYNSYMELHAYAQALPPQQQQQQHQQQQQQQQRFAQQHHTSHQTHHHNHHEQLPPTPPPYHGPPQVDAASFRTSSPSGSIYAQPKLVNNMSSFRTSSPSPNGHAHPLPPTQPKANPNLIAQLNARLNSKQQQQQHQQQQQQHVAEGIYGNAGGVGVGGGESIYMRGGNGLSMSQQQQQQQHYDAAAQATANMRQHQQQHQLQQQQQQHYTCPPPLEDPPPPPIYSATMPKKMARPSVGHSNSNNMGNHLVNAYAAASNSATLPKNILQQQRLQQQQQQQHQQQLQQQQLQQQQYQQPTGINVGNGHANQRPPMPLPQQQQHAQQQQQQQQRQPPIPSRHSSVQQKIFVSTNPFIQTTAVKFHSPSSVHSTPAASPTCGSPASSATMASIYGTTARGGAAHHQQQQQQQYHHQQQQHQQQQQQQQQHYYRDVAGGNSNGGVYYASHNNVHAHGHSNAHAHANANANVNANANAHTPHMPHVQAHHSNYATSTNIEKTGSIRAKTKAEFLENLNAKLAKQGMSGRAFAVRNLINSKALPDPRICHESLMDQIKRGATLKRNQKINDRSAPKIH